MHRLPTITKEDILIAQQWYEVWRKEPTISLDLNKAKRQATQSYTSSLTAKFLRAKAKWQGDRNFMIGKCESYDAVRGRSSDLYGFLDLIAVDGAKTIGIQACGADYQEHVRKMSDYDLMWNAQRWLAGGVRSLEIWQWSKRRKVLKGGQTSRSSFVWVPRCQVVTMEFLRGEEEPWFVDVFKGLELPGEKVA